MFVFELKIGHQLQVRFIQLHLQEFETLFEFNKFALFPMFLLKNLIFSIISQKKFKILDFPSSFFFNYVRYSTVEHGINPSLTPSTL